MGGGQSVTREEQGQERAVAVVAGAVGVEWRTGGEEREAGERSLVVGRSRRSAVESELVPRLGYIRE